MGVRPPCRLGEGRFRRPRRSKRVCPGPHLVRIFTPSMLCSVVLAAGEKVTEAPPTITARSPCAVEGRSAPRRFGPTTRGRSSSALLAARTSERAGLGTPPGCWFRRARSRHPAVERAHRQRSTDGGRHRAVTRRVAARPLSASTGDGGDCGALIERPVPDTRRGTADPRRRPRRTRPCPRRPPPAAPFGWPTGTGLDAPDTAVELGRVSAAHEAEAVEARPGARQDAERRAAAPDAVMPVTGRGRDPRRNIGDRVQGGVQRWRSG